MKTCIKLILLQLICLSVNAQQSYPDSLKKALKNAITDSSRYHIIEQLGTFYKEDKRDSALYYFEKSLDIAKTNNHSLDVANSLTNKGYSLLHLGNLKESLQCFLEAEKIAIDPKNENKTFYKNTKEKARIYRLKSLANTHQNWGHLMLSINENDAISHYKQSEKIASEINDTNQLGLIYLNFGEVYFRKQQYDSALVLEKKAETFFIQSNEKRYLGRVYQVLGQIYISYNEQIKGLRYYYKALEISKLQNNLYLLNHSYYLLSRFYLSQKNRDSSIFYARKAMEGYQITGSDDDFLDGYFLMSKSYQLLNKPDSVIKYQKLALVTMASAYEKKVKSLTELQKSTLSEQLKLQELEQEKEKSKNRLRNYAMFGIFLVFLLIGIMLYRNNKKEQKAKQKIEKAYADLKSTQTQLVQQEKLASLGALTAGIAHEIKNPLNFVNNFSELSNELIKEFKTSNSEEERNEILADLEINLQKINEHGKRADSIVKNMLQHSRSGAGEKHITDINQLCEEYLNLSFHGKRATDAGFNCEMVKNLDSNFPKVNCVVQDISRVILNLINNAFDAVRERELEGKTPNFKPSVILTTKQINNTISISISDNGKGIPKDIQEKIFEPFFTTKPAGQGTGLGLSLSYDIIKAHGGDLKVKSELNDFTEFSVNLPL
jgi:two-component system, NtrC family, sensor kinase